jgi:DNA-binding SARP family transcriptional activator/TolB-like protein
MDKTNQGIARLHLFGPLRLFGANGMDVTPRGQKARGLLALVALARDGRLARAAAAGKLWSGSHDAKANLRQCLRDIRASLDAAGTGLLIAGDQALALDRGRLAIDVLALPRDEGSVAFDLAAYDDDCLLRDIEISDPAFDDWLALERTRWRGRLHQVLEAHAQSRLVLGDLAGAIASASRLVGFEPTLESAHRVLMRCHADQGDRSQALRQFEMCRERLAVDLGVAPSEATLALRATIARPAKPHAVLPCGPATTPCRDVSAATGKVRNLPPMAWRTLGPPILLSDAAVRVALAPFKALSETRGDQLHTLVVGEALAVALARFTDLGLVDEAVATADGSPARRLDYRIDGSVARLGGLLRLTVRLWHLADGMLLWVEHFQLDEGKDSDTLDELALNVAARLEEAVMKSEMQNGQRQADAPSATRPEPCVPVLA